MWAELFEEALFALSVPPRIEDGHTAGSQDVRGELFGIAQAPGAESFQDGDENLLGEIGGGVLIAEVTQAVEANAGGHAAEELGFGFAIVPCADLLHQLGVGEFFLHYHIFYV
jgi:hypothetical protein